jgi:small Trp-rich protein
MYLLGLAIVLSLLKLAEIGLSQPGAGGRLVYGAAAAWWAWADASGYTKRKAMEKMDQRKKERSNVRAGHGTGSATSLSSESGIVIDDVKRLFLPTARHGLGIAAAVLGHNPENHSR